MQPTPINLSGRAALVTGGGKGIGRVIAEIFARTGADMFLRARKEESHRAAAEPIR